MTPADNDRWPDDMIRLLREPSPLAREPTATEAAAYVGMQIAEYGSYLLIAAAILGFGVMTGWLG